eukprot:scpid64423/ scgid2252/ 
MQAATVSMSTCRSTRSHLSGSGGNIGAGEEVGGLRGPDEEFDTRKWIPLNNRVGPHGDVVQLLSFKTECCKNRKPPSYGTCFLAKSISGRGSKSSFNLFNEGEKGDEYVCFFTVAHNLYCYKHRCYAEKIALVHMKQPGTLEWTARTKQKEIHHGDTKSGFYRVPEEFKTFTTHDAQCRSDYGLIVLRRDSLLDVDTQNISLCLPASLRPCYQNGAVCGYPQNVYRRPDIPGYGEEDGVSAGVPGRPDVKRYCVTGAQYCSAACSTSAPAVKMSDKRLRDADFRRVAERNSNGIFSFPQNHFDQEREVFRPSPQTSESLYRYYIEASPGNSGSPVYVDLKDSSSVEVVGIHRGPWCYRFKERIDIATDCNIAVRLTEAVLDRMRGWLDEYVTVGVDCGEESGTPLDSCVDSLMDDDDDVAPLFRVASHLPLAIRQHPSAPTVDIKNVSSEVKQTGSGAVNINVQGDRSAVTVEFLTAKTTTSTAVCSQPVSDVTTAISLDGVTVPASDEAHCPINNAAMYPTQASTPHNSAPQQLRQQQQQQRQQYDDQQ